MYKTLRGLVLREVKYKESSKILTILTEEEGKITAEAKGALRKGAKFGASAQCLVWSELTFFENRGRYTLTEGSVLKASGDLAARAEVYDARGNMVRRLLDGALLGTSGTIVWDGRVHDGTVAPRGQYLIMITIYDLGGTQQVLRRTVAVL